jgi:hypothetical protein
MRRSSPLHLALACLVALLFAAPAADAGERKSRARKGAAKSGQVERTVTRTAPDGSSRTSSHATRWERGDGQWTGDTVHTGPNGRQGTTHVDGAKTEVGAVRDVARTGPGGRTSTTRDEIQRTDDGYTRQTTHTGPKGGVTTRSSTGSYDADSQTFTRETLLTRPDGSTSTTEVTRQRTPSPDPAPAE